MRVAGGRLRVRNAIYERVFDRDWVRQHMPGAELRRQREAFRRGLVRMGSIAAIVVLIVGWLAVRADNEGRRANRLLYYSSMSVVQGAADRLSPAGRRMLEVLDQTRHSEERDFEWGYWWHLLRGNSVTYSHGYNRVSFPPRSEHLFLEPGGDGISVRDIAAGRVLRSFKASSTAFSN